MAKTINKRIGADKAEQDVADGFKKMMRDAGGRRVINWLLEQCHVYHQCITPEQEGERRIGLKIITMLNANPDEYLEMQRQMLEEARIEENIKQTQRQEDKENDNESTDPD